MTDNQDNPGINVPPPPRSTWCLSSWGRLSTEESTSPSCRAVRHEA